MSQEHPAGPSSPIRAWSGPLWGTSARTCPPVSDGACDVLVVGAGIVGLTTALAAARAGASVIVTDRARLGAGTSASTTGVASVLHGTACQEILSAHGLDAVTGYLDDLGRAMTFIRAEVTAGGVPARELPCLAAVEDGHHAHFLQRERAAMRPAGINPEVDDVPRLPFPTRPAISVPGGVALDPRQYVEALGRAVVATGSLLFEGSTLDRLDRGRPVSAHFTGTDESGRQVGATVRAGSVVLATGAPHPDPALIGARLVPVRVQAIAANGLDLTGAWRLVDDPDRPIELRPGHRPGQVVVAGAARPPGSLRVPGRPGPDPADELTAWVAGHLPGLEVTHRWSYDAWRSYDGLPLVGELGMALPGVYVATGFGDDHTALATAGALQLADHLVGGDPRLPWSPVHPRGPVGAQLRGLSRALGSRWVRSSW